MANLNCGSVGDFWVGHALDCLPDEIWAKHGDRLAFMSTTESDGRRLSPQFVEGRHVIVLSERVIPLDGVAEDHSSVRYLFFVVLHEVAHAVCAHRPPSELTAGENQAQEDEANALAFTWFNGYLQTKQINGLQPYTPAELSETQEQMKALMVAARQLQ